MGERTQNVKDSFYSNSAIEAMAWLIKRTGQLQAESVSVQRLGLKPSSDRHVAKGKATAYIVYRKTEAIE